ncbi:hypothetical protein JCM13304A_22610 [Desulfothermus okinawensis JCM 13304]
MAILQHILLKKGTSTKLDIVIKEQNQKLQQKSEVHYLCKFCKTKITSAKYKIKVNGKFRHVCANPHGYLFELGCFSNGKNFVPAGNPSKEFTWFPGYAWQVILCATCFAHLGWLYTTSTNSFLGLILTNLIEENS